MSDRLNTISNNGNGIDYENNNIDVEENNKSWFCRFCNTTHLESGDCPQAMFGEGDRWCSICRKMHYDNSECPKGGKFSSYCTLQYVNEQEHFSIHEHAS